MQWFSLVSRTECHIQITGYQLFSLVPGFKTQVMYDMPPSSCLDENIYRQWSRSSTKEMLFSSGKCLTGVDLIEMGLH